MLWKILFVRFCFSTDVSFRCYVLNSHLKQKKAIACTAREAVTAAKNAFWKNIRYSSIFGVPFMLHGSMPVRFAKHRVRMSRDKLCIIWLISRLRSTVLKWGPVNKHLVAVLCQVKFYSYNPISQCTVNSTLIIVLWIGRILEQLQSWKYYKLLPFNMLCWFQKYG